MSMVRIPFNINLYNYLQDRSHGNTKWIPWLISRSGRFAFIHKVNSSSLQKICIRIYGIRTETGEYRNIPPINVLIDKQTGVEDSGNKENDIFIEVDSSCIEYIFPKSIQEQKKDHELNEITIKTLDPVALDRLAVFFSELALQVRNNEMVYYTGSLSMTHSKGMIHLKSDLTVSDIPFNVLTSGS